MSSIKIIKGLPIKFTVSVRSDETSVDLHDNTWETELDLRYQTVTGNTPFTLNSYPFGDGYLVDMTGEQTGVLDTNSTGYILVIKASKIDGTVNLRNIIQVNVINDL